MEFIIFMFGYFMSLNLILFFFFALNLLYYSIQFLQMGRGKISRTKQEMFYVQNEIKIKPSSKKEI